MNLRVTSSLAIVTLLGCGKDSPTAPEVLPQTLATVQAAVDMVTTGQIKIVGTCLGTVPLNCPGGTLAAPTHLSLTRTADSVALVTGQDYYYFSATMSAVSPGIPVTIPLIGACTLTIDTSPGISPTITLTGTVHFASQTLNGPIDRLDFSDITVTDFETADVSITGSLSCASAGFSAGFYIGQLQTFFEQGASLCSAPGPALLQPCPATAAASRFIARP